MEQATAGQIQNQNQRQPQSNREAVPATGNSQQDELKGLSMMMQELLQGMQIQGKALNQVSTDINTRMDNMFTELNTKYDTVSNHIKRIDVQLAQTAESVKRQQGTLLGKSEIKVVLDGDPHTDTKKLIILFSDLSSGERHTCGPGTP
ncbi:hypothetical protein F2Q69_00043566 [Brassica cretica]|uniref:Uncharacterized protein n=1 Tax=Brassica cretica TaxID=69181 RepID=A0A8S9NP46_BRACR|nr:hypothetical protein F2Q69_00043566 [Brassica cretica]